MRTRDAILPDAEKIHQLISAYSGDGTLLPRDFAEICENVRDFVVLEHRGRIVGCGALASLRAAPGGDPLYHRGSCFPAQGGGKRLVEALLEEAEKHQVNCICLFTRKPDFFAHLGFTVAQREDLPDKIYKDCCVCPRLIVVTKWRWCGASCRPLLSFLNPRACW